MIYTGGVMLRLKKVPAADAPAEASAERAEQRLADVRSQLQACSERFTATEQEIAKAFEAGDDGRIEALSAERDDLLIRVGSLTRDERAAKAAAERARAEEDAARFEATATMLRTRLEPVAERLRAALDEMADAWCSYEQLRAEAERLFAAERRRRESLGIRMDRSRAFVAAEALDISRKVLTPMKAVHDAHHRRHRGRGTCPYAESRSLLANRGKGE